MGDIFEPDYHDFDPISGDEPIPTQANGLKAVYITPDTPLYCHICHDIEAPEYRLRRSGGKLIALCFKNGGGCWEKNPRPMCDYQDHTGCQCDMVAEWDVRYGKDMLERSVRCLMHVAPALIDVGEHRIYRI